jgi:argininosuccinate lyase
MFSPVYVKRVLGPCYDNWKRLYADDALAVHQAHLTCLVERGIVEATTGTSIARAIEAMEADFAWPQSIPEGVEDLYFVFERELGNRIGEESAAYLHTARSRNDMDTTVFRLALKRSLQTLAHEVLGAIRTAQRRAAGPGSEKLMVLYTHGQPANVSTLGHYLAAVAADLAEGLEELVASIGAVDRSTMGACAITGSGFDLDRVRVGALLGLDSIVTNTYQAISSSHWLTRPACALEAMLCDLVRVSADLFHKASCEVGLLDFPDALVQSSSIMPQKRNPVIIEHLRIQAGMAMGSCATIRELFRAAPYQDVNEVADAPVSAFIDSLGTAASAFALFAETVAGMEPNEARAREIALRFGVTTTELADEMVRRAGVGFRTAHRACAAYARSGGDLAELRASFQSIAGRELPFSDAQIVAILDPAHFVEVRRLAGGPAPEGMAVALAGLAESLDRSQSALEAMDEAGQRAKAELSAAWNALLDAGRDD